VLPDWEIVLEEMLTSTVPDDELSVAEAATAEVVSEITLAPAVDAVATGAEDDALSAAGVALVFATPVDSSEAREEAALDSTLENSEASELDTAESVAVAAMLESSELSAEARLESALVAPAVTVDGTLLDELAMLDTSESTEDWAEATTLEASEATDETIP